MAKLSPPPRTVSRRTALATLAAVPLGLLLGKVGAAGAVSTTVQKATSCVLSPAMTEGPFFVDEKLNRADLTTGTTDAGVLQGLPLALNISVVSTKTTACAPLSGIQLDVWHADALGNYSDVNSYVGQKFLRGYQISDTSGHVGFKTIYPGWYQGRAVHIHIKARVFDASGNQTYEFSTQLFFDDAITDTVMANAPYNSRGSRDTRNAQDSIYGETRAHKPRSLHPRMARAVSSVRSPLGSISIQP
jgi:protocatechuate 3,4-dioxygenase beta subunit